MKINEIVSLLREGAALPQRTCDSVKVGDGERTVSHIGVTMTATLDTLKKAKAAGCDLLIAHEPTFYTHLEDWRDDSLVEEKTRFIKEAGITVYRHHDAMHFREKDSITAGMVSAIGLKGRVVKTEYLASSLIYLDAPISIGELTAMLKERLSLNKLRVAGTLDGKVSCIALCFGLPEGVFHLLRREGVDCVLTGEAYEWQLGEYARDAAAFGKQKTLIVMEHIASERAGMCAFADELKEMLPDIPVTYFETESVYTVV